MTDGANTRVAIACQGGGSHTAFTAGVLQGLLQALPNDAEVVALSGTSGGAICAALAWDGLVRNDRPRAIGKLQAFWDAMSARDPVDQIANRMLMTMMSLRDMMVVPEVSPYHLPTWGEDKFRAILEAHFDFEELRELARRPEAPALQIGAVEVLSGHFEVFTGEVLSAECLLASAAIPEMFRAVSVPGRGMFWDGLFSQNPPIHDLTDYKIDELWVIQINSSSCAKLPTRDPRDSRSAQCPVRQSLDGTGAEVHRVHQPKNRSGHHRSKRSFATFESCASPWIESSDTARSSIVGPNGWTSCANTAGRSAAGSCTSGSRSAPGTVAKRAGNGNNSSMHPEDRCPTCGQRAGGELWRDPFTGSAARRAAGEGQLERWVHRWLTGAGRNVPMSRGLRAVRRWWLGPVAVPVGELTRIVGPEPAMAYPRGEEDWAPRLEGIAESIRDGWDVPPVISEYRASGLVVCDGNHRCEAQRRMGCVTVSCIVWFNESKPGARIGRRGPRALRATRASFDERLPAAPRAARVGGARRGGRRGPVECRSGGRRLGLEPGRADHLVRGGARADRGAQARPGARARRSAGRPGRPPGRHGHPGADHRGT